MLLVCVDTVAWFKVSVFVWESTEFRYADAAVTTILGKWTASCIVHVAKDLLYWTFKGKSVMRGKHYIIINRSFSAV